MSEPEKFSREMTAVRLIEHADGAEVIFLESAQFYRLLKENPAFASLAATLRNAIEKGIVVKVTMRSISSDIIEDVMPAE